MVGTTIVFYALYKAAVFDPLQRFADDLDKNMDDATKKALEAAEEESDTGLFLPFPLTLKMIKPPPYRGSDPEWQEFIKISKDVELRKTIKSM